MSQITDAPVELESTRLLSMLRLVFEDSHYSPDCECERCLEVKENLVGTDKIFVDEAARIFQTSDAFKTGEQAKMELAAIDKLLGVGGARERLDTLKIVLEQEAQS